MISRSPLLSDPLTFNDVDQLRFAALTGDVNPIHVDAVAARRLLAGRQVVHGIHTLLAALDRLPEQDSLLGKRLDVEFANPVCIGDTISFIVGTGDGGTASLEARVNGLVCTRIVCSDPGTQTGPAVATDVTEPFAIPAAPLDRPATTWPGTRQEITLPTGDFTSSFPRVCATLGSQMIAAIGLLSAYVGMVCPGLHSVFNSLSLFAGTPAKAMRFEVVKYDPRYRVFVVAFDGPIRGELRAFQRPVAQSQPSMHALLPLVPPKLFAERHVWVVGGSRGLGELSAKLLAAGGAEVLLTYSVGRDDALRVVEEISAAGRGRATTDRLDVHRDEIDSWVRARWSPNAVLYFPSPRIFRKKLRTVEPELLEEFLEVYVHRFARLCEALNARAEAPLSVFVPSTVYIDNRPRGLAEYAMAKAAAEVLVADLSRALPWLRFIVERLPRLATDQTATTFTASSDVGTEVLLQILQRTLAVPT